MNQLLNQRQAAHLLGLSVRTLERHRTFGTGPRFVRLGRLIRYRESDLADWVDGGLRFSTSDNSGSALISKGVSS
jgi:predicted DNA-binding transcriptional regulator AlpA